MKSLIIIPAYNEKENIKALIQRIININPHPTPLPHGGEGNLDFDILVIEDNSPDGTGHILDSLQKSYKQLAVIHRPEKLGLGTAYIQGFKYALDKGYDYIFTMDADFSHNPDYLQGFLNELKKSDLVIGSRYIPQGGVLGWPRRRKLLSRFGNFYAKTATGVKINDFTSGFTGIRRKSIESLPLDEIKSEGYGFLIELKYRIKKKGFGVKEVPIIFVDRIAGKSKISRNIIFEAMVLVWKMRLTIR